MTRKLPEIRMLILQGQISGTSLALQVAVLSSPRLKLTFPCSLLSCMEWTSHWRRSFNWTVSTAQQETARGHHSSRLRSAIGVLISRQDLKASFQALRSPALSHLSDSQMVCISATQTDGNMVQLERVS